MPRSMRSPLLLTTGLFALAACAEAPSGDTDHAPAEDRAPAVGVTTAAGVAADYRYAFRLPASRIATAQESHAGACERLGPARCRIAGMEYRVLGENRVEGMLSFRLDPALAREFGKQGIAAIERAEGQLIDASLSTTEAGAVIVASDTARADAAAELARIDRELARSGLPAAERVELQTQRTLIVRAIADARSTAGGQRAALASTPMSFEYRSGKAVHGFDGGAPFTSAIDMLGASARATLAFVLGTIGLAGPPALVLLLLFLAWRRWWPVTRQRDDAATLPA